MLSLNAADVHIISLLVISLQGVDINTLIESVKCTYSVWAGLQVKHMNNYVTVLISSVSLTE